MYNQHTNRVVPACDNCAEVLFVQRVMAYLQWNQLIMKPTPFSMSSSLNMQSVAYWHECPVAGNGWVPDHRLSYGQHFVRHTHSGDSAGPSTGKTIRDDNEAWLHSCRVTRVLMRLQMTRYLVCAKLWDICINTSAAAATALNLSMQQLTPSLVVGWTDPSLNVGLCRYNYSFPDIFSPAIIAALDFYCNTRSLYWRKERKNKLGKAYIL